MQPDFTNNPAVAEINEATTALETLAADYAITTADAYQAAGEDLRRVKGAQKRIEEVRQSFTRPLDEAKRAIMDFFRGPADRLADVERRIKGAMVRFSDEQERLRRAEQARLEEQARKDREKLEAQAAKAAAAGKTERAEEIETRAAQVVAPVVQREVPKVAGVAMREVWKFEVTDAAAVPRAYLVVDEKKIGGVVRAMKGDTTIPGVRVWAEKVPAASAA